VIVNNGTGRRQGRDHQIEKAPGKRSEKKMSHNLFLTATETRSGKTVIALGLMEMLLRKINRVGFFRPIVDAEPGQVDASIHLIASFFKLDIPYDRMYGLTFDQAGRMLAGRQTADILEIIINQYNRLREDFEFILIEGTDFASSTAAFEFDINADIIRNLSSPVVLVASAYQKTAPAVFQSLDLALESLRAKGCATIATIVNRTAPEVHGAITQLLMAKHLDGDQPVYILPEEPVLAKPTVGEIARSLDAQVLCGEDQLHRHARSFTVAAMQLRNFLPRIEHGTLIITPGDRADVIVGCLAAVASTTMEKIAGIVLTGGLQPEEPIWSLIKGFPHCVPILSVGPDTFPTATRINDIKVVIAPENERKITRALALFEQHVAVEQLAERVVKTTSKSVTPKMFEYELVQRARKHRQHIVLPEGDEPRILRAVETLLRREVVDITLLGNEAAIRARIKQLGLRIDSAEIVDPFRSERMETFTRAYFDLRSHRGITLENARDAMGDPNYFGTMMVFHGMADGMVSGATHSTAATIRPAFEIIKAKPHFTIVSSVFLMCLADRVLVYGDCAINPDPDAGALAEIALASAQTARTFGIDPVVAMLSYSSGASGRGRDVDKVREATILARRKAHEVMPDLKIEGPIQYDAAVDPEVGQLKMPGSQVAGRATVFIFPDLNTGNNTYKAVQRTAGVVAIGPVLQGLKHPVNDLSRGATVTDIVNTVALTAIQAQAEKELA
jgi:phosphate acetyltransferase